MEETVVHHAVIEKISPGMLTLRLAAVESCGGCRLAAVCGDRMEQTVEVAVADTSAYVAGQSVEAVASAGLQLRALCILILLPLLALCGGAAFAVVTGAAEVVVALSSLGSAALCFGLMYLFRGRINSGIVWKVL